MRITLSLFFALTIFTCYSQNNSINKEKWHWDSPAKNHNPVRKVFYNEDFPAATLILVAGLYMKEAKIRG